ncbi:LD-carboxypeptidase [Methylibium sp.]|uniref:LD-carboxypeptidase n=1 Tax=Methylibium sp. TaxID=2067992 RepID=UPI00286B012E|nr:LD-carboxypeptidase [Methylibium sp.]
MRATSVDEHDASPHACEPARLTLSVFAPSGVLAEPAAARRALRRLLSIGFDASLDATALARSQRFAGDDDTRLAALHRVADAAPSVAMALRGGYGLTRLLDRIEWPRIARSIERGTRWVGYSDFTALHLGALAHGALATRSPGGLWAGPLAHDDFSRTAEQGGVEEVTEACFLEAMHGELEAVGFRTEPGFDGLEARGTLWGGNLTVLLSLLGTKHWPRIKGGILFLEDVNEHPYRVERGLLQLHQAGVLQAQKAVVLGAFSDWRKSPLDRGYGLKTVVTQLRAATRTPILSGLPFGHVATKVCLPVGRRVNLVVEGRDVLLAWG